MLKGLHSNPVCEKRTSATVDVAHICSPKPGERENGDAVLVRSIANRQTMLAVIDGLGHGPEAAKASQTAIEELGEVALGTSVLDAMHSVHRALRGSRGAAATLCILDGFRIEACAVGNVQLLSVNCPLPLVMSAGVLGHQVPKFRISACEIRPGARIALLSDGLSTRFRLDELRHLTPKDACRSIFAKYRRLHDDATALVADVLG